MCQAVKLPDPSQAGNAHANSVLDVPMESVAMDKFAMFPVRHGKKVLDYVILCVDRHRGYLVAVRTQDKG